MQSGREGVGCFATTHWSVILAAQSPDRPEADEAVERLCRTYWPPVHAYIRRRGHSSSDAEDLTQEFFARFLEKRFVDAADAAKGRFRSLLLTAVSRFLANDYDRVNALKRGGGALHVSRDAAESEDASCLDPVAADTPATEFDRRWAEVLLETSLRRLETEMVAAGLGDRFEVLKPYLAAGKPPVSGMELAHCLGLSLTAAYSVVHRLRRRYGELLREEVARTVVRPDQVDDELRHLAVVLTR